MLKTVDLTSPRRGKGVVAKRLKAAGDILSCLAAIGMEASLTDFGGGANRAAQAGRGRAKENKK